MVLFADPGLTSAVGTDGGRRCESQMQTTNGRNLRRCRYLFCKHEGTLTGNPVDEDDLCCGVDLTNVEHEHLTFGLRYDIAFGNNYDICELQHGSDLPGGMDSGEFVNYADGRYLPDMRRTPVAQTGTFGYEDVKAPGYSP